MRRLGWIAFGALLACAHPTERGAAAATGANPTDTRGRRQEWAEYFRRQGLIGLAITTMTELRDANALDDEELAILARMQAYGGSGTEAYRTLDHLAKRHPDVLELKLLESELMVLTGKELKAAELMDQLIRDFPGAPGPLVQRARYFLARGRPDMAAADLALVRGADRNRPEVQELQHRIAQGTRRR